MLLRNLPTLLADKDHKQFEAAVKEITRQIRTAIGEYEENIRTVEYSAENGVNIVGWLKDTAQELEKKLRLLTADL